MKLSVYFFVIASANASGFTRQEFSQLLTSEADAEMELMEVGEADATWDIGRNTFIAKFNNLTLVECH